MYQDLNLPTQANKADQYESLLPQLQALIAAESDLTANLANISAGLHQAFGFLWVGFYIVKHQQLVLGPFQGPIACTRIQFGRGVCGTAWQHKKCLLVPDVHQFPGHIACSSLSVAEIVIPIYAQSGDVVAVLDVDSEKYDTLDDTDVYYLAKLGEMLSPVFS